MALKIAQKDAAPGVAYQALPRAQADWLTLLPFAVAVGLLAALAWPMLLWWHWEYSKPESYYAHAPIIPFLVGLMLWHRRDVLRSVPKLPSLTALAVLIPALCLLVFARNTHAEALESTGFLLTIWSAVGLTLGGRFLWAASLPLAFLALMAPLPGPLLNDATQGLQAISTALANGLLHLMGFSTTRLGNVISMENFQLAVDVPCSGFKLLLALTTFNAAFAYLVDGTVKRRLGLFLLSMPLSLAINGLRIALIGVVGECAGKDAAHTFHDWSGLITLVLGFTVLFSLAKAWGCKTFAGWAIF